jgi:diguanylate cyclase (GGDEF)-like protein/PAS domain S-box-containing protein
VTSLWHHLTEPDPAITAPAQRRRARMVTSVIVTLGGLVILSIALTAAMAPATAPGQSSTLILLSLSLLCLGIALFLSRTRHFVWAAGLTLFIVAGTVMGASYISGDVMALDYLVFTALLASLFFSLRGTALATVAIAAGLVLIHALAPRFGTDDLIGAGFYLVCVGVVAMVTAHIRRRDIELIERQSEELKASEQRFRAVVQTAREAIVTVDDQGRIAAWNAGAHITFGCAQAEALGQPVASLLAEAPGHNTRAFLAGLKKAAETPAADRVIEMNGRRRDGSEFPAEVSLVAWDAGQARYYTAFIRDVTQRKQAEAALRESNQKLRGLLADLEKQTREIALLSDLADFLQASQTVEDAYAAIAQYAGWLFPATTGAVYAYSPSRNDLAAVAVWGEAGGDSLARAFTPEECWALRRGRVHLVAEASPGLACRHAASTSPAGSLCVPMMAQGDAHGVLHLQAAPAAGSLDGLQRVAVMLAEHTALALANLNLRETLRSQSIRDPLTGLFNRRYLEETLDREIRRAERAQRSFGIMMIDADHFKQLNDLHGHQAGDAVLQTLGKTMLAIIRGGDVACRFGGEEFVLMLPEASLEATRRRAEELRERVSQLNVPFRGQLVGRVTLSVGVAAYPEHGLTREALMRAADQALYEAKQAGRNRTVAAGVEREPARAYG